MAKKIRAVVKVQAPAGKATPAPPIGPALGQHGINIMAFVKEFNARTADIEAGAPVPVVITYYADKSFSLELKTPPASFFLKKAAGLKPVGKRNRPKASTKPGKEVAGSVTLAQVREIATAKMKDLNANDIEAATKTIEGSARAMGLEVVEG